MKFLPNNVEMLKIDPLILQCKLGVPYNECKNKSRYYFFLIFRSSKQTNNFNMSGVLK